MASLSGHELAITTARVGVSRVGATRIGFIPAKTWNGVTPGTAGGVYVWARPVPTSSTWTQVTR